MDSQASLPFTEELTGGVRVLSVEDITDGAVVDFEILAAERAIPSVVTINQGRVDELVIRAPSLPKPEWSKDDVRSRIESVVSAAGVEPSRVDITPGLRREPRHSSLTPDEVWYPHIELIPEATQPQAARLVNQIATQLAYV